MNEDRIKQIMAFEKKAMDIYETAVKQAEQLPNLAEQDVQAMIVKARQEAEEEARQMLEQSTAEQECARLLDQLAESLRRTEQLARMNRERALDYALHRVIGLEQP